MTTDEYVDELMIAADHANNMTQFLEIMSQIEELLRQRKEQQSS